MHDGCFLMIIVRYNHILIYLFGERKHTKIILNNYLFTLQIITPTYFIYLWLEYLYIIFFLLMKKTISRVETRSYQICGASRQKQLFLSRRTTIVVRLASSFIISIIIAMFLPLGKRESLSHSSRSTNWFLQ